MKLGKMSRFSAGSAVVASLMIAFLVCQQSIHKVSGFAPACTSSSLRAHRFVQPLASSTLEEAATMATVTEYDAIQQHIQLVEDEPPTYQSRYLHEVTKNAQLEEVEDERQEEFQVEMSKLRSQLEATQAEVRLLEAALDRTVTHLEHELVASKEALSAAQRQSDDAHAKVERLRQSNSKLKELASQGVRAVRQCLSKVRQGTRKVFVNQGLQKLDKVLKKQY